MVLVALRVRSVLPQPTGVAAGEVAEDRISWLREVGWISRIRGAEGPRLTRGGFGHWETPYMLLSVVVATQPANSSDFKNGIILQHCKPYS